MFRPTISHFSLIFAFLCVLVTSVQAGEFRFFGQTDKDPLQYAAGEEMTFTVQLLEDGKPISGKTLKWSRRGDDGLTDNGEAVSDAEKPLTIKTSITTPGFVHVNVQAYDENGQILKNDGKNMPAFDGGAGVRLDEIQGYAEPADFDEFWAKQKARLAEVPIKATMTEVESGNEKVLCYDIRIDCIGKPVSGYYCKPREAKPKSLPAYVSFQGYGVHSAGKQPWATDKLALQINAHGIDNGQPTEYYENLRKTTLRGYAFSVEENARPETSYFCGMMLRLMRALQWIKTQPEWNGEVLVVGGGSQGGLQCLTAAGLDPDVTECNADVPWCLDLAGHKMMNRLNGWRPEWAEGLGYFDAATHAKRIRCKVNISAGLGDYVCPPSGQMVLYNNLNCPKKLTFKQGRTHGYNMPDGFISVMEDTKK